ncbi:MAG: hypothetical protein ACRDY7_18945 [Acidimicrobiia bacterium]
MRRMLTIAIPMVLGVGVVAAAFNEPEQELAANQRGKVTETTAPAVIEAPAETTTTTLAPETTTTTIAPETTTTTVKPTTTTTQRRQPVRVVAPKPKPKPKPTTTTAPPPPPTTTTAPQPTVIDCGTGTATIRAGSTFDNGKHRLTVTVVNEATKDIEIDAITVEATYSGVKRVFRPNVAGRRVFAAPGDTTLEVEVFASDEAPEGNTAISVTEFRFHTAGIPECTSQ